MKRIVSILVLSLLLQYQQASVANEQGGLSSTSVTFGASYPQTGPASIGVRSYYSGISAYFSHLNENGGVHGRKVSFLLKDDSNLPTMAIVKANEFINRDQVFGFISTAPSCGTQIAMSGTSRLGQRGIPNLFVDCNALQLNQDSGLDPTEVYSSTRFNRISYKDESSILKSFIDSNLPNQNVLIVYQDDQNGSGVSELANSSRVTCSVPFVAGTEGFALSSRVTAVCGNKSPIKTGDVLLYSGSATGLAVLVGSFESKGLKLKYFVNNEAFNLDVFQAVGVSKSLIPEIHFLSSTNLISEVNITSVNSLLAVGQKYSQGTPVDQRFLNGMNAGYIIAHVLAAVGPDLTKERFLRAFDLYAGQFDVLGVSERSTNPKSMFGPVGGILVRYAESKTTAVSDMLSVEQGRVVSKPRKNVKFSNNGLPTIAQLLPNSTPVPVATPTPTPIATPKPTPTLSPSPTVSPTPSPTKSVQPPVLDLDGEEEEPFGKLVVKKDKTRYSITVVSNLAEEVMQIRATKKGQKAIVFKVTTDESGNARFTTTRILAGYQVALSYSGQALDTVRAP